MNFRKLIKIFIPKGLFRIIEPYGHLLEAFLFNLINFFPTRNIKVIGVTGTNGKTTTTFLIHHMLYQAGYKVGVMTTVGYGYGLDITPQIHHMTNVSTREMLHRIKIMKKEGMEWLVLETTSHALAQYRVFAIPYRIAVFTNLTQEHLAYHRTFERYRQAKLKMFKMTNRYRQGLRLGIVNADDPNSDIFANTTKNSLTYGLEKGSLVAKNIQLNPESVTYQTEYNNQTYHIICHIPGTFNVYNSLAAVAVGIKLGLSKNQIEQGIASLKNVEGRMNPINQGQDFTVIVDYAHSPDSFEKLFKDLKPIVKHKLIVLFGSLGGGDINKRSLQGKLAGEYADYVYICEEDDRQEPAENIMKDIVSGVKQSGKKENVDYFLIHDRPTAIKAALSKAETNDIVLLLGKGHEKTIEHADGEHPYNETEVAKQALKELGYTKN